MALEKCISGNRNYVPAYLLLAKLCSKPFHLKDRLYNVVLRVHPSSPDHLSYYADWLRSQCKYYMVILVPNAPKVSIFKKPWGSFPDTPERLIFWSLSITNGSSLHIKISPSNLNPRTWLEGSLYEHKRKRKHKRTKKLPKKKKRFTISSEKKWDEILFFFEQEGEWWTLHSVFGFCLIKKLG